MWEFIFEIEIEMIFQEILIVIDFVLSEIKVKAKFVLKDDLSGIEKKFEIDAVVQGVPYLEVDDEKGVWVIGGWTGLVLGGELPCFGEGVRF